jgi:fructose-1,6-bisphosphatase/inositol monophosphatase family enzyme
LHFYEFLPYYFATRRNFAILVLEIEDTTARASQMTQGFDLNKAYTTLDKVLAPEVDRELLEQAFFTVGSVIDVGHEMLRIREEGALQEEVKSDGSFVTRADKVACDWFGSSLPKIVDCPILSEELGNCSANFISRELWVVDELDGTNSFREGYPNFGSNIALLKDGELQIGVAGLPALKEVYFAIRGIGAFLYSEELGKAQPIKVRSPAANQFHFSGFYNSSPSDKRLAENFIVLDGREFIYDPVGALQKYCEVACGRSDGAGSATCPLAIYDIAGTVLIVREAGGEVFDVVSKKPVVINPNRKERYQVIAVGQMSSFSKSGQSIV